MTLLAVVAAARINPPLPKFCEFAIAGNGALFHLGDGAAASLAGIPFTAGLAREASEPFVSELDAAAVRVIAANGTISTFAGQPNTPGLVDDPVSTAHISKPSRLLHQADLTQGPLPRAPCSPTVAWRHLPTTARKTMGSGSLTVRLSWRWRSGS
jgi:hypothetical protein